MAASNSQVTATGQPAARSERELSRIIVRNTLALTIASWISKVVNFAFIVIAVRYLGEVGLGNYATVVAFVGLFGVFFELGLAQYVERTVAQGRDDASRLFWNLVVLRVVLASVGVAVIPVVANIAGLDRRLVIGIFLFALTFILSAVLVPMTTMLTARERFDVVTATQIVGQLLTAGLGIAFLMLGAGFFGLIYTGFIVMPLQILMSLSLLRRLGLAPSRIHFIPSSWPRFIRASVPFGLISLALTFNFQVDTVILRHFHGAGEVGLYNACYRLVFSVYGIISGFVIVLTPSLAREHIADARRVRRWVQSSVHWIIIAMIPAAAGLTILASSVIGILYGEAFKPASTTLAVIVWDIPLVALNALFGNVSAAVGVERAASRIYLISAAGNLVLNLLFIPRYGMMAAAAITVLTDLVTTVQFMALLKNQIDYRPVASVLGRVALATSLMSGGVLIMESFYLPGLIVIGIAIYGCAAYALRLIDAATIRQMRQLVGHLV